MASPLKEITRRVEELNKNLILFGALIVVGLLSYLDYLSGFELSFSLFYLFPVSAVAWHVNKKSAYWISLSSALAWALSNDLAGKTYTHPLIGYWNPFMRLALFMIVSALFANLKQSIENEKKLSRTDYLTGIINSRAFRELAHLELLSAQRFRRPITLAYIDVDNFKQVNDRFGHSAGDKLLKLTAETMAANLRRIDIVARLGGDEFAVLLPEANEEAAKTTLLKLKTLLLSVMKENQSDATFSIGAVTFKTCPINLDELLRQADELMYSVKANGKNNIYFRTVE